MRKKKIIILGGGGHAKSVIGTIQRIPEYTIVGFLDDDTSKKEILGIHNIGRLFPINKTWTKYLVVLGIGHVGDVIFRQKVIAEYKATGFVFETICASSSIISPYARMGKGIFIAEGVIIQPDTVIKDYSIINTGSSIDHDCIIGTGVHIAPGVTLSGAVKVGDNTLIGTGSSVIQEIEIAENSIIGAGSAVVKHCKETGTYVGVPAKLINK